MTQPISEEAFHDLLELETVLEDLSETQGWQALKDWVETTLKWDRLRLLGGEIHDHDEYLKVAWRIRGAEAVLNAHEDVAKQVKTYRRTLADLQPSEE